MPYEISLQLPEEGSASGSVPDLGQPLARKDDPWAGMAGALPVSVQTGLDGLRPPGWTLGSLAGHDSPNALAWPGIPDALTGASALGTAATGVTVHRTGETWPSAAGSSRDSRGSWDSARMRRIEAPRSVVSWSAAGSRHAVMARCPADSCRPITTRHTRRA